MNVLDEFKNYKRKFIQISHRIKRYHELKQDITKYYNLLQEYKTTYDNFILGLENESNSNQ